MPLSAGAEASSAPTRRVSLRRKAHRNACSESPELRERATGKRRLELGVVSEEGEGVEEEEEGGEGGEEVDEEGGEEGGEEEGEGEGEGEGECDEGDEGGEGEGEGEGEGDEGGEEGEGDEEGGGDEGGGDAQARLMAALQQHAEQSSSEDGLDDEEWEDELQTKTEQLRALLSALDPLNGAVHPDDEAELAHFYRGQRGVSMSRKMKLMTELCTFVAGLQKPDPKYVPDESQQSTESQLEAEMLADVGRSPTPDWTPDWTRSANRSGHERWEMQLQEPESLKRLRAPPGTFGSPLPHSDSDASSSSHRAAARPCAVAPRAGRPSGLADAGRSAKADMKKVSAVAHDAPRKAAALFEALRAAAPEASGHGNVVAKSKAVSDVIFERSGDLNETIAVIAHFLQRAEMRPIVEHLGYSQRTCSADSLMVDALARFIKEHIDSSFRELGSHSGGTRSTEAQAAHELLVKAMTSEELLEEKMMTEAAGRIGVRYATFRHLLDCRVKMDAELEHSVQVGALLKVSRRRRCDACDDDAELFDNWAHETCRYDSSQTTGGKKVRRFGDVKVDGQVTFEEHERRTLPCSRLALCERFLESAEYKAFLLRKGSEGVPREPVHVSFFQKRICSCMVDEKMTQCADSIDTQFNIFLATWTKALPSWYKTDKCTKADCVCKEPGFFEIKTQKDLWSFLFRGECAPQLDPTRGLTRDTAPHSQLAYECISCECKKKGCMKNKLALWELCPVQNKLGSATEIASKKWTPVPRGMKAKATGDDDGDDDYDPKGDVEKWSKEMLPFESSRPEFIKLLLESIRVSVYHCGHSDCTLIAL